MESSSKWPLEMTSFSGREQELIELGLAARRGSLVTLIGPNGVGKSRLVLHWLRQECATREVLRLSCRGLLQPESLVALAQRHESEVQRLGEAGGMLLLDGLDAVVDAAQEIVGRWLLQCPTLTVLTTSTRRLGLLAEQLLVVSPLPTRGAYGELEASPAAELYLERSRALGARATPDGNAVQALVTALQGMPLFIELAAEKAAVLGPAEFLKRRGEWLDFWVSPIVDRERSQRSIRASLARVYAELPDSARLVWQTCAVFAESFSIGSLQMLWARYHSALGSSQPESGARLLELVQLLLDRSLLLSSDVSPLANSDDEDPGAPGVLCRFQLLDHLRLFARELASQEGQWTRLYEVHASWMADRAAEALVEPGLVPNLEIGELYQALEARLDASQRLSLGRVLVTILAKRGTKSELQRVEKSLLRSPGAANRLADHAPGGLEPSVYLERFESAGFLALSEFALALAGVHLSYGAVESAAHWLAQAECALLAPQAPSSSERSSTEVVRAERTRIELLRAQAGLARARGETERAEEFFLRALSSAGAHHSIKARVLSSFAGWLFEQDRAPEAEQRYTESLTLHRHQKSSAMAGVTLNNLALLAQHSEDWSQAESLMTQALAIHRKFGHRRFEGIALGDLGTVALERGALRLAARLCGAAARVLSSVGDDVHTRLAVATQGVAFALLGETGSARAARARSVSTAQRAAAPEGQSAALEAAIFIYVETSALLESFSVSRPAARQWSEPPELDNGSTIWNDEVLSLAGQSDEVRLARRIARWCHDWACATQGTLVVSFDGNSVRMPDASHVDLSDKLALARLLRGLVARRLLGEDSGMSAAELVALAWPGEKISPAAAKNRLHVAISKLRNLGLGAQLQQLKGSYLLAPDLPVLVQGQSS